MGEPAGERVEQHDPERVQVRPGVGGLAPALLRRQVLEGAEDGPVLGDPGAERGTGGQAEVEHRGPALGIHKHVLGLEIPVDDPSGVDLGDDLEQRQRHVPQLLPGAGTVRIVAREGRALHQLHHQVGPALGATLVQEADDAGDAQQPERRDLPPHARPRFGHAAAEELHGDGLLGELVEGAEHVPRPADADHVVEPIPPADEIICPRHVGPRPFPRRRRGERSVARRFPRHPARVSGGGVCPAAQQHDRARDAGDA